MKRMKWLLLIFVAICTFEIGGQKTHEARADGSLIAWAILGPPIQKFIDDVFYRKGEKVHSAAAPTIDVFTPSDEHVVTWKATDGRSLHVRKGAKLLVDPGIIGRPLIWLQVREGGRKTPFYEIDSKKADRLEKADIDGHSPWRFWIDTSESRWAAELAYTISIEYKTGRKDDGITGVQFTLVDVTKMGKVLEAMRNGNTELLAHMATSGMSGSPSQMVSVVYYQDGSSEYLMQGQTPSRLVEQKVQQEQAKLPPREVGQNVTVKPPVENHHQPRLDEKVEKPINSPAKPVDSPKPPVQQKQESQQEHGQGEIQSPEEFERTSPGAPAQPMQSPSQPTSSNQNRESSDAGYTKVADAPKTPPTNPADNTIAVTLDGKTVEAGKLCQISTTQRVVVTAPVWAKSFERRFFKADSSGRLVEWKDSSSYQRKEVSRTRSFAFNLRPYEYLGRGIYKVLFIAIDGSKKTEFEFFVEVN